MWNCNDEIIVYNQIYFIIWRLTGSSDITASADGAWQKRGSGMAYNSLSGMVAMITTWKIKLPYFSKILWFHSNWPIINPCLSKDAPSCIENPRVSLSHLIVYFMFPQVFVTYQFVMVTCYQKFIIPKVSNYLQFVQYNAILFQLKIACHRLITKWS